MNQGKLVPEDVIFGLLSKRLEEGYRRGESGFILDGIPRTTVQAVSLIFTSLLNQCVFVESNLISSHLLMLFQEILDEIADVDMVVNLKCKEDFGGRIYSPLKSMAASFEANSEKLRMYTEQVYILHSPLPS